MKKGESDSDEDEADSDDEDDKVEKRHAKESNLFKKIGTTQQDEEHQIKSQFKAQAADQDSDEDDFLKVKKNDNESMDESDGPGQ